ncbi:response regulator transcription factor [Taibaiella lutea]|uniref:Response regulator transcription factor n=1 Tax=Taibaiella lutea TaxID=2608001 RepID=A0A5M6CJT6_9BACT|nr:LytTR family DNA-binding domain-containing protein [Taibaiella lutea]KAA5534700.1 response regulator transcription factor [Taibaiella lutea]
MRPLKYIIIEDNRLDELSLLDLLSKYPLLQHAATAGSIIEAQTFIKHQEPDIIFADIEMPDGLFIEFAKRMKNEKPIIIFVTSHSEFALEGFETSALDYLLKPISEERFALTYRHIMGYHKMSMLASLQVEQSEKETIVFKDGFNKIKLPVQQVLYLQAMQDYTKIVTVNKNYLANSTLSAFLNKNAHFGFIRIHRSYAMLSSQIKILKKDRIIGENFELPIGKTYRTDISKLKL